MIAFRGIVYRILPKGADPQAPAAAPEGRFHSEGQGAIYTSLSPEGTVVAIRRYLRPVDPSRVIVPLAIEADEVADLRGNVDASVVLQDKRTNGLPAPTWSYSDAARQAGAQGMLYSSRSRPELTHLVLFPPFKALLGQQGMELDATRWLAGH